MGARKKPAGTKLAPRIFQRDIASKFTEDLLPIIQNLTALGYNDSEIGTIVGFAGQLTKSWLKSLRRGRQDVAEAIKTGRLLAKGALISKLVQASLGYDYEEVDETWIPNGEIKSNGRKKWILQRKVVHRRHQAASTQAMLSLATRLLPEVYKNDKEMQFAGATEEQIKKLSGTLINESAGRSTDILDNDSKRTESEHRISCGAEQKAGEGQGISASSEKMDIGISSNSV